MGQPTRTRHAERREQCERECEHKEAASRRQLEEETIAWKSIDEPTNGYRDEDVYKRRAEEEGRDDRC